MTNCPNCGAPVTSWKCEYCATVFERPETVTLYRNGKPLTALYEYTNLEKQRLQLENALLEAKARALHQQNCATDLYKSAIEAMRRYGNSF